MRLIHLPNLKSPQDAQSRKIQRMRALAIVAVAQWHLACPDIPGVSPLPSGVNHLVVIGNHPFERMEERCTTSKWCGSKLQTLGTMDWSCLNTDQP